MNRMLVHVCCAPCATAVIEDIQSTFDGELELFYYNPNIEPENEVKKRYNELVRYVDSQEKTDCVVHEGTYDNDMWKSLIDPLSSTGEKGMRCWLCYYIRLKKTFEKAVEIDATHVSTTLSISPHKNLSWLTSISKTLSNHYKVTSLIKQWNYKRSIEISREFKLYRQNYCGCIYSHQERAARAKKKNNVST